MSHHKVSTSYENVNTLLFNAVYYELYKQLTGRGFSSQADKVALLRNELSKTIAAQKLKKEQIDKLNKTLHQK